MGYPKKKFDPRDYVVSDTYPKLAAQIKLPEVAEAKLFYIHTMLILPLADKFESMPYVTSAYRNLALNTAVGSTSRQHREGEAVDFEWPMYNGFVVEAMNFIADEMYHQTGWCYLWLDVAGERFKHIHWALPLGPDRPARKNPKKFWYKYEGGFHDGMPIDAYKWGSDK